MTKSQTLESDMINVKLCVILLLSIHDLPSYIHEFGCVNNPKKNISAASTIGTASVSAAVAVDTQETCSNTKHRYNVQLVFYPASLLSKVCVKI